MPDKCLKSIWELDPRWIRVESLDDTGQPLGFVYFEPNHSSTPLPSQASSTGIFMAAKLVLLDIVFRAMCRLGMSPGFLESIASNPGQGQQPATSIDALHKMALGTAEPHKGAVST